MSKAATVEHNYSHPLGKLQRKLLVRAVAQGGIRALRPPGLYDKYLQRYEAVPWLGFCRRTCCPALQVQNRYETNLPIKKHLPPKR